MTALNRITHLTRHHEDTRLESLPIHNDPDSNWNIEAIDPTYLIHTEGMTKEPVQSGNKLTKYQLDAGWGNNSMSNISEEELWKEHGDADTKVRLTAHQK